MCARRCLAKLEEYVPLKNIILKRIVLSPQDIQNLNQNLVEGDTIAGTLSLYPFLLRPFITDAKTRYHTPIKNLFMTGQTTWPGPGTHGTSGRNVAKTTM